MPFINLSLCLGLIKQFLRDVDWGVIDYLLVDTPPGTSDEHLSIVQYLKTVGITGAVVITTPQVCVDDGGNGGDNGGTDVGGNDGDVHSGSVDGGNDFGEDVGYCGCDGLMTVTMAVTMMIENTKWTIYLMILAVFHLCLNSAYIVIGSASEQFSTLNLLGSLIAGCSKRNKFL